MFCQKCGKEINDEAVVCVGCGCPVKPLQSATTTTPSYPKPIPESSGNATSAIVFAFLMPIVGLILGIIGACKYKNPILQNKCKGAIFISIGMWIVYAVILAILGTL